MERRGRVFIAPVELLDLPSHGCFWASWEVEDAGGDSRYLRTAEEAVAWGRARSDVVLIRLGSSGDDPYFSAGDAPVFGNDGQLLPVWSPPGE